VKEQDGRGSVFAGAAAVVVVIGYLAFELYGLHRARERMEPAQVYAQFVRARHAVSVCGVDSPARADFERNFEAVTRLATSDLAEREPDVTPAQLQQMLAARRRAIEHDVDALVAEHGCKDNAVWRLLKLYEVRSRLTLRY
jgi:hypothetical protein